LKNLRIALAVVASALALGGLAACQKGPADAPAKTSSQPPVTGSAFLGAPDAKVTVIEFFAPTCPICKAWHDGVYPQLKSKYIDTKLIKFEVRELPSHNPPVDATIFGMARCVGADLYFPLIDSAFVRQQTIDAANRSASGPGPELEKLAKEFGLDKARMSACADDPKLRERLDAVATEAQTMNVPGTPALFVNGKEAPSDPRQLAELSNMIDQALAAAATVAPASAAPASPSTSPH
jgi:protein-disulfide isomerase